MTTSHHQAAIESLQATIARLETENGELQRENRHLKSSLSTNSGPVQQTRRCIRCRRDLPDGPSFYPGYLESQGANSAVEAKRFECVYCR